MREPIGQIGETDHYRIFLRDRQDVWANYWSAVPKQAEDLSDGAEWEYARPILASKLSEEHLRSMVAFVESMTRWPRSIVLWNQMMRDEGLLPPEAA